MPRYTVVMRATRKEEFEVEADNEEQAAELVEHNGEGDFVRDEFESWELEEVSES